MGFLTLTMVKGRESRNMDAMVWTFVFPQNLHMEILPPNMMALGGGAFRR